MTLKLNKITGSTTTNSPSRAEDGRKKMAMVVRTTRVARRQAHRPGLSTLEVLVSLAIFLMSLSPRPA